MSRGDWRVAHSGAVSDQFRRVAAVAGARGRLSEFIASAEWLMSELERTPLEFGESRGDSPGRSLLFRCGSVGPVWVDYAVHEESGTVHLRRFAWSGR